MNEIRLTWKCRDIGYGVKKGSAIGHWIGKRDTWGKRTFDCIDRDASLYLFDDEVVSEEPWTGDKPLPCSCDANADSVATCQRHSGDDPSIKDALNKISEADYPETVKYLRHALTLLAGPHD